MTSSYENRRSSNSSYSPTQQLWESLPQPRARYGSDDYLTDDYPRRPASRTYLERIREKQRNTILSDPNAWAHETRALLNKDHNIPLPRKIKKRNVGGIAVNNLGQRVKGTTIRTESILPKENQLNPSLPLPPLAETDLDKGLINLINRKLVPSFMDLTTLVSNDDNCPISTAPARLNPHHLSLQRKVVADQEQKFPNIKFEEDRKQEPAYIPYQKKAQPTVIPFGNQKIYNVKTGQRDKSHLYFPKNPLPQQLNPLLDPIEEQRLNQQLEENNEKKKQQYLRTYLDLMDEYSLHHVIIRHGTLLSTTPEYLSFYRTYQYNWTKIYGILVLLEKILRDFSGRFYFVSC